VVVVEAGIDSKPGELAAATFQRFKSREDELLVVRRTLDASAF
jgi:hypothetical protein